MKMSYKKVPAIHSKKADRMNNQINYEALFDKFSFVFSSSRFRRMTEGVLKDEKNED